MPRQVDHGARRRQIIEALWRITTRGGLDRATFREVAAAAGVSVNLIQYYFGTKDDLLVAALEHLGHRAVGRIAARTTGLGDGSTERARLRAIFDELFPDDEVSRTPMLLFIVFEAAALSHTGLARAEARQMTGSLYGNVALLLRRAQEHACAGVHRPRSGGGRAGGHAHERLPGRAGWASGDRRRPGGHHVCAGPCAARRTGVIRQARIVAGSLPPVPCSTAPEIRQ